MQICLDTNRDEQSLGMGEASTKHKEEDEGHAPRLLDAPIKIQDQEGNDREGLDFMWGTDKVKANHVGGVLILVAMMLPYLSRNGYTQYFFLVFVTSTDLVSENTVGVPISFELCFRTEAFPLTLHMITRCRRRSKAGLHAIECGMNDRNSRPPPLRTGGGGIGTRRNVPNNSCNV